MAQGIWKQRMRRFFCPQPRWIWWLRSVWIGIFVLFVVFLVYGVAGAGNGNEMTDPIKIFSANRDRYASWSREKAVDFGLEQSATTIKFLFVAAAALLGYLSKTLIEPLLSKDTNIKIPTTALVLFRHSTFGCCFSLFYGFIGFTYFMYLPVDEEFSPFGEIGIASNCQQLSFLAAVILMVSGMIYMWNNRPQVTANDEKGLNP